MKINKQNNFYTDICSFLVHKKKVSKKTFENIFSNLRIDTTFKTTTFSRMNDLNTKLRNYSQKFFLNKMLICDFGVSSGQTTLELYNGLNKSQIKCIFGFDKQIYIKIFKFKKFIFLFSLNNKLLMVEFNKYCLRYRYFFFLKNFKIF